MVNLETLYHILEREWEEVVFGQQVLWVHWGNNGVESWSKLEKYRREESVELGLWVGISKDNPGHWVSLSLLLWLPILCLYREPGWIPCFPLLTHPTWGPVRWFPMKPGGEWPSPKTRWRAVSFWASEMPPMREGIEWIRQAPGTWAEEESKGRHLGVAWPEIASSAAGQPHVPFSSLSP